MKLMFDMRLLTDECLCGAISNRSRCVLPMSPSDVMYVRSAKVLVSVGRLIEMCRGFWLLMIFAY